MKQSKKELIINHPARSLYNIVLDIEKYPDFIPWCASSKILSKSKNNIIADLFIDYKFFKKTFSSDVKFDSKNLIIKVIYIKGPLKNLHNKWHFKKISKEKTKVFFHIQFEFKNIFYQKISEIFFDLLENKMISSFKKRADEILN
tara:strand:- start:115 stop:549 length:435 start_codon:yes stop_codon:yes gene_type:complete